MTAHQPRRVCASFVPSNLEQLRSRGLHYLVASRQGERTRWLAEFETLEGFDEVIREPSPRNPRQKKTKVEVKLKRTEEETFVLCISDGRKQKDRAIRDKHEQRLLRDLDKLQARIGARRLADELKIGEAIGRLKERLPARGALLRHRLRPRCTDATLLA